MSLPKPGMDTARVVTNHVEKIRAHVADMLEMRVMTETGPFSDLIGRVVRFYFTNMVCENKRGELQVIHVNYTIYGNNITYTIRKLPFRDTKLMPVDAAMVPYLDYLRAWDNLLKLN